MGFSYLGNKNWKEITREERYFCAELFFEIKKDVNQFVKWLNEKTSLSINPTELGAEWEVGFEVCFYRDLNRFQVKPIRGSGYSQKRTFDLCLFSEKRMIIIEAKSQTGFGSEQNQSFVNDSENVLSILKKKPDNFSVHLIGIASSCYLNSTRRKSLPEIFNNNCISWKQIFESYCSKKVFMMADECYGN